MQFVNLSIGKKIGTGIGFLLVLLFLQGISAYYGNSIFISTSQEHNRSYQFVGAIASVNGSLNEVQSGMRSYVITGDKDFLSLYESGLASLEQDRQNLRNLTYTPSQTHQVNSLDRLIQEYLVYSKKIKNLRDKSGFEAAKEIIATKEGKLLTDEARNILDGMEREEDLALKRLAQTARETTTWVEVFLLGTLILSLIIGALATLFLTRMITSRVSTIIEGARRIGGGEFTYRLQMKGEDELCRLGEAFDQMAGRLQQIRETLLQKEWLQGSLVKINARIQGKRDLTEVTRTILSELAEAVDARHGVIYNWDQADGDNLALCASYGYMERKNLSNRFKKGEGLVGQCALEGQRILLTEVPADYVKISSGLGNGTPLTVTVVPAVFNSQVKGVLELASFHRFTDNQLALLDQVGESLGNTLNWLEANRLTDELLKQSQMQAEELQVQQSELKKSNSQLEEQTSSLEESTRQLKIQQQQMKESNELLKKQALELSQQKKELEVRNREVEQTKMALQERAEQLAITSKYKSDFLANMSHELRTPLNSLLILSDLLAENKEGNLTKKQTEHAHIIHSSGADLLSLINEILDMAKIESGKMTVDLGVLTFPAVKAFVEETFRPVAEKRNLEFSVELSPGLPVSIQSDWKRLQQVLKNLLSNALKFTPKGKVDLSIGVASGGWSPDCETLNHAEQVIAFAVRDTGIGIPADKMQIVFEPFQQADTGTARKYGGTGLGLSISREIARLLGGEIRAISTVNQGSVFTLYLPVKYQGEGPKTGLEKAPGNPPAPAPAPVPARPDEPSPDYASLKATIQPGDRVLLVIEDDPQFAIILGEVAQEKGFRVFVANDGKSGMDMARQLKPDAITLDLLLPDISGWTVLEQLKHHPETRLIPVHIISVVSDEEKGLNQGAMGYLVKPVSRESLEAAMELLQKSIRKPVKSLLVVEDDEGDRMAIAGILGGKEFRLIEAKNGREALAALGTNQFDAMILDLGLPDISGFEVLDTLRNDPALKTLPVIIYTGKELTADELAKLKLASQGVILKGEASPQRLLDEVTLFLHSVEEKISEARQRKARMAQESNQGLKDRKILVVDDDPRNLETMSTLLGNYGLEVFRSKNGLDCLKILENTPGIEAVIMDVMMPGMDGLEATRALRKIGRFKHLPVFALTAKAMKGDREKCLEAGCSEYLTKPLVPEQLITLLRIWLYQ